MTVTPLQLDDLVAPIELVGFPRRKAQRHIGRSRRLATLLGPSSGVSTHGIITAVIAAPAQILEDPDQRQLFARGLGCVAVQQLVELCGPPSKLWSRLDLTLVFE